MMTRRTHSRTATLNLTSNRLRTLMFALPISALALGATAFNAFGDTIKTHGISTFGDVKYPADFAHLDYVNPNAPKGGEMSFAWSSGSFDSIHPYTRKGRGAVLSSVFFESMLEGTADTVSDSYCLLCEYMEFPEDRSWVIFKIRDEAKFSDGTDLTADDALFSFEILRDEGLPSFQAEIGKTLQSAEVLDNKRIKFTFNPTAPLRGRIESAGGLPVFSRASHEASGLAFEDSRTVPLTGSSAYVLGEFDAGKRVVYNRNPDYWGKDLPINVGRSNFDSIRIEYFGDGIAAFEGFTAGVYHFRQENSSKNWATSYDFPGLDAGHVVKRELPDDTLISGQSFMINLREEKFQDVRVREALGMMFNFEWTNKTLFYGLYAQGSSLWHGSDLAATGLPSSEELALLEPLRDQLKPEVFEQEVFSFSPSNEDNVRDRRKARKALALLQEAGYEIGDDGLLRKDGKTLDVAFLNSSPLFDRIINPYVENLRSIGVNASMDKVDHAQETERERNHDYDIATGHLPMGYEPGSGLRQYFNSANKDNSLFNMTGVGNEAIDVLVEHVVKAETESELHVAVKALDRVLRWERFRIPQWYNPNHWVSYYDYFEHPDPLPRYALGFLDFWWVNQDKLDALKADGAL